jgi:nitrogen fixation protein NifB
METIGVLTGRDRHPCFNHAASGTCGRVHLPVAPRCNIQCGYCSRKYDCVNESRPGVTSAVLSPEDAAEYVAQVLEKEPRITVAGIAGPGDPLANPEETLSALRLVRARHPGLLFCLATNGLALPGREKELASLGVSHVTVTVNAVNPSVGAKILNWARDGKRVFRKEKAAELLVSRQLSGIAALKAEGITVKVNTIVVPGVNDSHVLDVARKMADLGVDILNIVPMFPNEGTTLFEHGEPDPELISSLRREAGKMIPQMEHCRRCRADAAGLLCEDRSAEFAPLLACPGGAGKVERPYVAVATREGVLVNLHLGEAAKLAIFGRNTEGGFRLVEERRAPEPGTGPERWEQLAVLLADCRAVVAEAMGEAPRRDLAAHGTAAHECSGFIGAALAAVYDGKNIEILKGRKHGLAKACCGGGDGTGC